MKHLNNHGDTIIEVMLAMTVLTAILFTSWGVTNRASQISLAARERTVMVNQIKEQAEILKTLYSTNKSNVSNVHFDRASPVGDVMGNIPTPNPCDDTRGPGGEINGNVPFGAFYFDESARVQDGFKQKTTGENGAVTWIQQTTNITEKYIDFYIRACWTAQGEQAEENSHIIVRLNKV